jgi:signal transduction histidine kinase
MLPHSWRRFLAIVRLILALSCLTIQLAAFNFELTDAVAMFAAYTAYAASAVLWRGLEDTRFSMFALAFDLLFFLLAADAPVSYGQWIAAVFYGYLLISAIVLHDWRKTLGVCITSVAGVYFSAALQGSTLFPVLIAGAIVACALAIERDHLQEHLSQVSRQSVLYRYDAEKAREAERQRIAADFHDGPLQSFISFQMRLEIIRKLLGRDVEAAARELHQLQEICQGQLADLRSFVRSMRPADEGMGLTASLSRMAELFQRDTGIATTFSGGEVHDPADTELSLEVLQIVREALNNIQKHSGASRVAISAARADHQLQVSIEDNGEGFPFTGAFSLEELELLRLGPVSIKRRVKALEGELALESGPGRGSKLAIRVPL